MTRTASLFTASKIRVVEMALPSFFSRMAHGKNDRKRQGNYKPGEQLRW